MPHPLWPYRPAKAQTPLARLRLRMRRLGAWLKLKRQRIALLLVGYVLVVQAAFRLQLALSPAGPPSLWGIASCCRRACCLRSSAPFL